VNFWEHFARVLPYRPIQALAALYWHATRRRVRARNRLRVASSDLPFAYEYWIRTYERIPDFTPQFRSSIEAWDWHPRFSVVLYSDVAATAAQRDLSLQSLQRQIFTSSTLVDADVTSLRAGITAADGDYVLLLRAGDVLSEAALFHLAEALQTNRDAAILYGDHDELDHEGRRRRPWFKPRWNQEMFLGQDYLTPLVAIDTALALAAIEEAHDDVANLVLTATSSATRPIIHVPHILCHTSPRAAELRQADRGDALARHLGGLGATCAPGPFGTTKVQWPLPDELPMVSIIIPTKDKLHLLQPCVDSVLRLTNYDEFEILIIDNGSLERRTAEYLAAIGKNPKVRVIDYPHPYNFSAINNFAVGHAKGPYLCLLNNDTEVIEPSWLTELMRYAVRPDVGAAGAKLIYKDGTLQHAGVVIGIGEAAGHAHRLLPADDAGYFLQPHIAQFVSAVTAACLVVDKSKYLAVGGLDQESFAIAFNDVDFCLKLEKAGWKNVYVPHARLVHHESKSRGRDSSPLNIDRYRRELHALQQRWGTKTYDDPLHNPNLDRHSETFVVRQ